MDVLTGAVLFAAGVALSEVYNKRIRKALLGETCLFVRKRRAGRYGMGHVPPPPGTIPPPRRREWTMYGEPRPVEPSGEEALWPRYTAEDFNLIGQMAAAAADAVREGLSMIKRLIRRARLGIRGAVRTARMFIRALREALKDL